jgi:hypothetical protein
MSTMANLEEITRAWMTGIPTSIRFLGKSYRVVSFYEDVLFDTISQGG